MSAFESIFTLSLQASRLLSFFVIGLALIQTPHPSATLRGGGGVDFTFLHQKPFSFMNDW
jgi:hypothetical protein